jgi:predicted nicotinamide N-methyase
MGSIERLAIPGGWTQREVVVGPHAFLLLTPADPDELLNHLVEPLNTSEPHLADPYWAKLWPAAAFLAEAVLRTSPGSKVQGLRSEVQDAGSKVQHGVAPVDFGLWTLDLGLPVLELGCGSGLVGLAALAAGWEVTFSDYVPQAVQLAVENAARNGFPNVRGLVLDWRSPPDEKFSWILAADVTYDRTHIGPLLNTLERMLAPGGEAWLGDGGRGPVAEFLLTAGNRGWSASLLDECDRPMDEPVLGHCQRIVLRRAVSSEW